MIKYIYTIGFTKKKAEYFFELLADKNIETVIDIRLNNTSQLAAFAKYPDIEFFLEKINHIKYIHDVKFSPDERTLKRYKKKEITWDQYVVEFAETMKNRRIDDYIKKNYSLEKPVCLLCSEATAEKCHRRLVAEMFLEVDNKLEIVHL